MKKINYNCRTFVNHRNQVIVRVRWNKKTCEVAFPTGLHADPLKWNPETQRPVRGSTHIIGRERNPSRLINERIDAILMFLALPLRRPFLNVHLPVSCRLQMTCGIL